MNSAVHSSRTVHPGVARLRFATRIDVREQHDPVTGPAGPSVDVVPTPRDPTMPPPPAGEDPHWWRARATASTVPVPCPPTHSSRRPAVHRYQRTTADSTAGRVATVAVRPCAERSRRRRGRPMPYPPVGPPPVWWWALSTPGPSSGPPSSRLRHRRAAPTSAIGPPSDRADRPVRRQRDRGVG